jgi:hypothetical protein
MIELPCEDFSTLPRFEEVAPFYCQEEEDEEEIAILHAYKFQAIFSRLLLLRRNSTN